MQTLIAGCLDFDSENNICNKCNAQSQLSVAADVCECIFDFSLAFNNFTDENGDILHNYYVDNNLVFNSGILPENSDFNCADLLSINYSGSDDVINSALQTEFESRKCRIMQFEAVGGAQ